MARKRQKVLTESELEEARRDILQRFIRDGWEPTDITRFCKATKVPKEKVEAWLSDIPLSDFVRYLKPVLQDAVVKSAHSFQQLATPIDAPESGEPTEDAIVASKIETSRAGAAKKHRENLVRAFELLERVDELLPSETADVGAALPWIEPDKESDLPWDEE